MIRGLARTFPYLLLFPAILPLVYWNGLLYPFLTLKTLLFRGDAILALAIFVALLLAGHSFYTMRLRNWRTWIPGALLVLAYLSSLLGVDFYHSFWSIFDRGDGLLTLTSIVLFFYLIVLYADKAFIERLLKVVVSVASVVALVSVLQWFETISGVNLPFVPQASGRIGGTLGNAAYLASYLGITFFVTLSILPSLQGRWRTATIVGAALQIFAIIGTATRGSFIALLLAAFFALVFTAWKGDSYRTWARAGLVGILILSGLFFAFRGQLASVPFEPVSRLASISLADKTVESRLFIWGNVISEPLARPLGVGAEHIQTLFNRFYDPTAILEQWFDRTHNAFLDYLVQYGILGLILYLALIGVFVWESLRLARSSLPEEIYRGRLFLLVGLVYAVQNFFVFDSAAILWLFFALFASLFVGRGKESAVAFPIPKMPVSVPLGVAGLTALLIIPVSFLPLRANMLLADTYTYHVYDIHRAVSSATAGYALGTYADIEYGYQLYEMYTERQVTMLSGEEKLFAFRLARDILAKNFARYPYDARTAVYYAHVLDMAPAGETPNESLVREVLGRAIELSPKRIQPRYLLANISLRKGDAQLPGSAKKKEYYDEAIRGLQEYSDLLPNLAEPRYVLATLYLTLKENVVAQEWAEKGLAVYEFDENTARRASRYYVAVEDWENARRFLTDVVSEFPADYPLLYDLAKIEFLVGNVERAREIVEELRQKAPDLVETDKNFLNAITAYEQSKK